MDECHPPSLKVQARMWKEYTYLKLIKKNQNHNRSNIQLNSIY